MFSVHNNVLSASVGASCDAIFMPTHPIRLHQRRLDYITSQAVFRGCSQRQDEWRLGRQRNVTRELLPFATQEKSKLAAVCESERGPSDAVQISSELQL